MHPSLRALATCLPLALLPAGGCSHTIDIRPNPTGAPLPVETAATILSRPPCMISEIDTKDVTARLINGGLIERTILLAPGIHTLSVSYDDGAKHSVHTLEVSVVLQAGHKYRAVEWPPKFFDVDTGQDAKQQIRGVK